MQAFTPINLFARSELGKYFGAEGDVQLKTYL